MIGDKYKSKDCFALIVEVIDIETQDDKVIIIYRQRATQHRMESKEFKNQFTKVK